MNSKHSFPGFRPCGENRVDVFELPEVKGDKRLFNVAKRFLDYNTIRRDLRNANQICDYIINLHKSLINGSTGLNDIAKTLFLVRGALMHAVILYARWFKDTAAKPQLSPADFFMDSSIELAAHAQLILLRDKYIAHNQLDILGRDRVCVELGNDKDVVSIESDWMEQQFIKIENLDMSLFQRCIHIVHDKIEAEILPKRRMLLEVELKRVVRASCRVPAD